MSNDPLALAKITWINPNSGAVREHLLMEGATASIGRSSTNDIAVPEQHVSRQHAVITYRNGVFMLNDLGSANGTFVNDQRVADAFPLASGDIIRLYVPTLTFSAAVTEEDQQAAERDGNVITASRSTGKGQLIITTGPQEGQTIPLLLSELTIGRATSKATWEIGLQDPSVSRPHARMRRVDDVWIVTDLGSANGTRINNTTVTEKGRHLRDGDIVAFGTTMVLYRSG